MFSVLLILLVALGFGLSLFLIILLFLNPKKYQNIIKDPTVVIVKIVEQHRENLPVNSAHGWELTPTNCILRCWQKDVSFHNIGSPVLVYACVKEIPCAAVILLNVIADVSTWSEWDIDAQEQTVHLELPDDPYLYGDLYMQCDQVFSTSKSNANPEIEMYRFGNLESNGTGWILLWSAKRLEWILYIAQPIDSKSEGDCDKNKGEGKCLLTALWGCEPWPNHPNNMPETLCKKVASLSEAISWSQLKIRPFKSLMHPSSLTNRHFPTIHSALSDLPKKPCVLLQHEKEKSSLPNVVLAVVPQSTQKPLITRNITGFSLILYQMKKPYNSNLETVASEEKRRSRRRLKIRSDSINSEKYPRNKHLDLENDNNRRSSSLSTPLRKALPELTVTQADDELKPPQRAASHSFLHTLFQRRHSSDTCQRSRSPSPSSIPTTAIKDKKNLFKLDKTSSLSSQEDLSRRSSLQDLEASDTNETDQNFLKMAQNVQDSNADVKALGEYSISAVLQENFKASLVDVSVSEEEQKRVSGGWVFKETNKNIAIFKKTTSFESCVFLSYLSKGVIPTALNVVWKTLCNPLTRFMYDDTVKKITVLHELQEGQKLIHMYNESVTFLHKEVQDFCILQTEKIEGSQFILGFHSVKDVTCPPVKDVVRGTVVASGWVVEPVQQKPESCQVSYLVQMVVSSPNATSPMEEISNMQSQCINNLSLYLSAKPPTFLPVQH